jgi:hypothetical protein
MVDARDNSSIRAAGLQGTDLPEILRKIKIIS